MRTRARNVTELHEIIAQRRQEINGTLIGLSAQKTAVYSNQNRVREAVHALLAVEDLVGGIGQNVSVIAREFNNSVQKTIQAEEQIQRRSAFIRFFAGGDEKAANAIEAELNQNRVRIQQLTNWLDSVDEDVKLVLQEQIQNLGQEQERLQELAQNEKKSKGILGWIWK